MVETENIHVQTYLYNSKHCINCYYFSIYCNIVQIWSWCTQDSSYVQNRYSSAILQNIAWFYSTWLMALFAYAKVSGNIPCDFAGWLLIRLCENFKHAYTKPGSYSRATSSMRQDKFYLKTKIMCILFKLKNIFQTELQILCPESSTSLGEQIEGKIQMIPEGNQN